MTSDERDRIEKMINAKNSIKLKPCPFCGGAAKFELWLDGYLIIRCTNCLMMTTKAFVDDQIEFQTNVWNKRINEIVERKVV